MNSNTSLTITTRPFLLFLFFFNDTATTEIYTLSLHDALPISLLGGNLFLVCEAGATLTEHVKFRRGPLTGAGAIVGVADQDVSTSAGARDRKSTRLNSSH